MHRIRSSTDLGETEGKKQRERERERERESRGRVGEIERKHSWRRQRWRFVREEERVQEISVGSQMGEGGER
jgi:hypothetical protein